MRSLDVAVLGAGGFVGSALVTALRSSGHSVRPIKAPRLVLPFEPEDLARAADSRASEVADLASSFPGADAVVVCAGLADATASWTPELSGANSLLPLLALRAADLAGVPRLVHVSTAAVQGRRVLDSSFSLAPLSAYARSKAVAELALLDHLCSQTEVVIYRPPGVHGASRAVTRSVRSVARSRWSAIGADAPAPQAPIADVARAISYLATCAATPPTVVHHPWSGITTGGLLECLGGRTPHRLPLWSVELAIKAAYWAGRRHSRLSAYARRAEVLMVGQVTSKSWLDGQDWGGGGLAAWEALAQALPAGKDTR